MKTLLGLKYYAKIYLLLVSLILKSKMQYRVDFFVSIVGTLFLNISGLAVFWVLFRSIKGIQDWNYYEIVFIYGFSLLAVIPSRALFANLWGTGHSIISGSFIKYYLRPLNLFFYFVSEDVDTKNLIQIVTGGAMLVYAWHRLSVPSSLWYILVFIALLASASMIMTALLILASSAAFWIVNSISVMVFVTKFQDFAKYPMTIFNGLFKFIFSFIIPIGYIAFYPCAVLLRPEKVTAIELLTPLAGILFFILAYQVWMCGARSNAGTGS